MPARDQYGLNSVSWESVSELINAFTDLDRKPILVAAFAKLWRRFAADFLEDRFHREYNRIKHGFRCKAGGFSLSVRPVAEEGEGQGQPQEELCGGSKFGTTIFVAEKLHGDDPLHIRIKSEHQNWVPENHVIALHLISVSLQNVIASAKAHNGGDRAKSQLLYPHDESVFDAPWQKLPSIKSFSLNANLQYDEINPLTKVEILNLYARKKRPSGQVAVEEGISAASGT